MVQLCPEGNLLECRLSLDSLTYTLTVSPFCDTSLTDQPAATWTHADMSLQTVSEVTRSLVSSIFSPYPTTHTQLLNQSFYHGSSILYFMLFILFSSLLREFLISSLNIIRKRWRGAFSRYFRSADCLFDEERWLYVHDISLDSMINVMS